MGWAAALKRKLVMCRMWELQLTRLLKSQNQKPRKTKRRESQEAAVKRQRNQEAEAEARRARSQSQEAEVRNKRSQEVGVLEKRNPEARRGRLQSLAVPAALANARLGVAARNAADQRSAAEARSEAEVEASIREVAVVVNAHRAAEASARNRTGVANHVSRIV